MRAPSKNNIFLLVACVLSVSLIIYGKQSAPQNNQINLETVNSTSTDETAYLSPLDKSMLGLSPEVSINASSTGYKEPNTLTNTFSKDFFSKYLQAQSGGAIDDQTKSALIQSTISQYSGTTTIPNHFQKSDIVTSSTLDRDKIKSYGNDFITIEDSGVREANSLSQSSTETRNLTFVGANYKKLANKLASMVVPEALVPIHLAVINNYYALGEILQQIVVSTDDPVKIVYLLNQLQNSQPERDSLYTDISLFMKNNGIIFNNDEPGHYWLTIAQ